MQNRAHVVPTLKVVIAVSYNLRVPAIRSVARQNILGEGQLCVAVNRLHATPTTLTTPQPTQNRCVQAPSHHVVVIVQHDEIAKPQVACQGRGLTADTLLQTAIACQWEHHKDSGHQLPQIPRTAPPQTYRK
jgi:hypothetical protein